MIEHRAYLLEVTDRRPNDVLLQELVDILARYSYTEFYWLDRRNGWGQSPSAGWGQAPSAGWGQAPSAGWGQTPSPRLRAYCEMQGIGFEVLDADAAERLALDVKTVSVPTFAAKSLCGRIEEMRHAMERGEATARSRSATRFLVTDFADGYAWHPLCVSLPAIILAGNLMTVGASAAKMDLEKELCSVMNLPVAGLLQKLGTLYLRGGARREDASEFFNILAGDCGYSRHPGITQPVLDEVSGICRGVRIALERWTDRNDWAKEISYAANLLDCACHRRNEAMLRALRDEHGRLWRLRCAPEGRVESLSKLPRF